MEDGVAEIIMTVRGPVAPADLACGPIVCREWLLNDQALLLEHVTDKTHRKHQPGDVVRLENLAMVRRRPFCFLHNMHLSLTDSVAELGGPVRARGKVLIVVCTPRQHWPQPLPQERARELLELTRQAVDAQIVCSTAPVLSSLTAESDFESEVARLVSDLAMGYSGGGSSVVRPGLLGEIQLGHVGKHPGAALALRVCVETQLRTRAPLLLSGSVSTEAYAILKGEAGPPGREAACIWRKCAFFDVPESSPVSSAELAANGAFLGFCPPHGAADIARPYDGDRPWKTEEHFLRSVSEAPPKQALISTGLRFRTDLASGGGAGLDYALQLVEDAGQLNLRSFTDAALEFLQYPWKPPIPPEEVEQKIQCHWCGTWKKAGTHFSKFNFDYCAPKCLTAHRKADFAPDARSEVVQ